MSTAPTFPRSPVPQDNGTVVRQAGCLIIGDEVLNGALCSLALLPLVIPLPHFPAQPSHRLELAPDACMLEIES